MCQGAVLCIEYFINKHGTYRLWTVVAFKIPVFQAWKVMESGLGPGKGWKATFSLLYASCVKKKLTPKMSNSAEYLDLI